MDIASIGEIQKELYDLLLEWKKINRYGTDAEIQDIQEKLEKLKKQIKQGGEE